MAIKGQSWFCTTGLPSDVVIVVNEMSFHLHKFPIMSKSRKLHDLITDHEQNRREENQEDEDMYLDEELQQITLDNFPGGSDAFELAAKFCYGVKIEITVSNAVPLRCAAEFLGMTEDFAEGNLVSRTERFLSQSVLRGLADSVRGLKSCEVLMPDAEDLGIVRRCIESIAAKASSQGDRCVRAVSWLDELSGLSLPIYKRVIAALKARDLSPDAVEGSLVSFAKRSIPGISRSSRNLAAFSPASEQEQRELLETVITNLPLGFRKRRRSPVTARFLFGLLRTASILRASEASRTAVERKIACQLEDAALDDLLVPSYSYLADTLYDVECVERILGHYAERIGDGSAEEDVGSPISLMRVGKLVDGYLSEIAPDAGLTAEKFCALALALPDQARRIHDGIYRAVDLYLRAHPGITEGEGEMVCGVMDTHKLTLDACAHAAQNDRLPLRSVVQVLTSGHLQLRRAVAENAGGRETPRPETAKGATWRAAVRQSYVLRLDMDSVRSRVEDLERECSRLRKAITKVDRVRTRGLGSLARRFGCRPDVRVCDSGERAVLDRKRCEH